MTSDDLFRNELKVINIGLSSFKESLDRAGAASVQVEWSPPLPVDPDLHRVVDDAGSEIAKANEEAVSIVLAGKPALVDLAQAIDVIPGMERDAILHAGPPVSWENMCGPMRGAIIGALLYEGSASDVKGAERLAASGKVRYSPCHEHATVGPMAGIVSPSMPVFVLENGEFGNRAFCTMNEGLGKVLRYGAYDSEVIERLRWMEKRLYPALREAVRRLGPVDLKSIIAQALHMGDEVHNRNRAATSLLYRILSPAVVETCSDSRIAADVLRFIHGNDHFFLNLSMPACKVTLDAARNVERSGIVVAMSRNGTEFGIQLAGTGGEWFTGPADVPDALFFPGFTRKDANPDIGDSSITETNGLGGFAIAASPAIVQFVGGTTEDALRYTRRMYEITVAENDAYQIPYLDFRGSPTGIDVVRVVEKSVLPFIDTGVAHKEPGIGQVGAGVLSAPAEPFQKAFEGLARVLRKGRRK